MTVHRGSTRTGRSRRRGQSLVEFALVLPLFLFLMFSLIEVGRAIYYIQAVSSAAREGARYAIVHGSNGMSRSGPPPINGYSDDPTGVKVVDAVRKAAPAAGSAVTVMRCWNGKVPLPASVPCDNAGGNYGPGTNEPGSSVYVRASYQFRPILADFLPLPDFTLTGDSTLVINN